MVRSDVVNPKEFLGLGILNGVVAPTAVVVSLMRRSIAVCFAGVGLGERDGDVMYHGA